MPVKQGELNFQQSPLYDTYQLAATTATPTRIVLFSDPISATKGAELTNLPEAYKLTPPENFTVFGMRFVPVGMDEVDLLKLVKQYTARLIVSGKLLLEAPVDFWAGGAGIAGAATTTATTTTIKQWTNGVADPRAIAMIHPDYQIPIGTGESFRVELVGTTFTSTAALFLRCYLDGFFGRAIG